MPGDSLEQHIAANAENIRERMARAARRARREASQILLVAVSKTFPAEAIRAAYNSGIRHFGENRIQEWEAKRGGVADLDAQWHFIGHLQSNKARRGVHLFHRVDSVDSAALAQKLDTAAAEENKRLPVLIEVRLGDEATKTGVEEAELEQLSREVAALPHLDLRGLMAIPPYFDETERVRPYFRRLRELRDRLSANQGVSLPVLSMGMSHDFDIAIEEGATEIRIGSALFGERPRAGD